jgi:signal transduction histidine kinase
VTNGRACRSVCVAKSNSRRHSFCILFMAIYLRFQACSTYTILLVLLLLAGCAAPRTNPGPGGPTIEFTSVPVAGSDNASQVNTIEGRVIGAKPEQQIVLYAKGENTWWVQPFVDQPFTKIRPNSRWHNVTHPGTDYAALLVEPGFQPPRTSDRLPTQGVITAAVVHGEPALWQRWWFPFPCALAGVLAVFSFYRLRLHQLTRRLNLRFEERLDERTRVAQELHDTLLQGVVSASMQLHVAVDQLPPDSPAQPALNRVLKLMGQVVEQGHNVVRGLRFSGDNHNDLERAFSSVRKEFDLDERVDFRVIVEGTPLPVRAAVRDDLYSIGREALVNAFRHSRASDIAVELHYGVGQMTILVRDNGCGIDPQVLRRGQERYRGLSGMRERAERIGARLKVLSRAAAGTEVELSVPRRVAFQFQHSNRRLAWLPWPDGFALKPSRANREAKKGSEINE